MHDHSNEQKLRLNRYVSVFILGLTAGMIISEYSAPDVKPIRHRDPENADVLVLEKTGLDSIYVENITYENVIPYIPYEAYINSITDESMRRYEEWRINKEFSDGKKIKF